MSIADQITRLNNAKAAITQSLRNKGVTVSDKALLDEYPALIDSIEVGSGEGSGGGDSYYEELFNQRTSNGNMMYLFYNCTSPELDLTNLDTSSVTNMSFMFSDCSSQITLGDWDTSNVISTSNMFNSYALGKNNISLDLSVLDFSNVTNAERMFYFCNIDYVDIRNLNIDISKLGTFTSYGPYTLFHNVYGTLLDLSSWNIGNASSLSYLFYYSKVSKIDLTNWVTTNVTNMNGTFSSCTNLEELIIPDWDMTNVTYSSSMFTSSNNLRYIDLSRSNDHTIGKIASLLSARTEATSGTIKVPRETSQEVLDALTAKYWIPEMPEPEEPEVPVDPPAGDIPLYVPGEFRSNTELTEVRTIVTSEHDNLDSMFAMCENLVSVNTQDWDTSNVYEMYYMFAHCKSLTALNLSNWVTDKVTRMAEMFMLCWNLTELDLSNFNTSNVTSVSYMFYNCQRLESLDLSNFDLTNLTGDANNPMGTESMFDSCYALTTLHLDNCSYDTITKIINSTGFPASNYGTIYCKAANQPNTLPEGFNWTFSYVD